MSVATLPPKLQTKLDVLARRLNRQRLLRGFSVTVLVLIVGAAMAVGLDAAFTLPPIARCLLAGLLITSVVVTAWRKLVRPLRRLVTAEGLAAAVEEEYPNLGERLTSAVGIAGADDSHGSPAFIRMLIQETDDNTRTLDFRRAAPPRATKRLMVGTIAAILVLAAPAAVIPDHYLGLGRRLLVPWDGNPAVMPFDIEVSPGNVYSARGRPLTIGVELRSIRPETPLPETCTLVLVAENARPLRLRMPAGAGPHAFAFHMDEVKGTFRYHVEAGAVETDTNSVIAVDPVELAGGPTTIISPPAYAKMLGNQTIDGLADLTVLEHGRVAIDCRFNHPAEAATLIFTPTGGTDLTPQRRPLTLSNDRKSGRIELPALNSAKLRFELAAGHGIITLTPEQMLTISPDKPPEFRLVTGLPEQGAVRKTDVLNLDLAVADDVAVAAVEIEYRVNDGPVQREPVGLAGIGTRGAAGRAEFKLAGKANDGDKLFVRLRATDNRDVPEAKLGPNVATYPPGDRWNELNVSADADSARQAEITARRDDIEKRLRALIAQVDRAVRRTNALHQDIEQGRAPAEESIKAIRDLSGEQAELAKNLTEVAGDAAVAGLMPLAEKMVAVREQEFGQAGEAFRAAAEAVDKERVAPLVRADKALTDARTKLEAILKQNRALADAQLDEIKLNALAERERELAEQAKKAVTPEDRENAAKEQEQIANELKRLTANDEALKDAVQAVAADDARKLAQQARKLAQAERDLDAKLREAEKRLNAQKLAELARQQQQLAQEAERLAEQTQPAVRAAKLQPLDAQPAAKAADDLKAGDADAAQQRQDQAARELDRLAENLQHGIEAAKDPREAANQLARLQEENRKRLQRPAEKPLALRQQEAIRKAVEALKVPAENAAAVRDRQQAADLVADAAKALAQDDGANAEVRMAQAKEALEWLAKDFPAAEDRLRQAREEVAQLRKDQEEIGRLAEAAARATEKGDRQLADNKRMAAARKEAEVAARVANLDVPGQEGRRDPAARAAARAANELRAPATPSVAAQADARRALERLAEALAGQMPADEKARELARQERALAAAAVKAVGDPAGQRNLKQRQEKVVQEAQALKGADAPVRQAEATAAVGQADVALRDKPNEPAAPAALRAAADKLDALAAQLAGRETEAPRADRPVDAIPPPRPEDLARQQRELARQTDAARRLPSAGKALQALVEPQRQLRQQLARLTQARPSAPVRQAQEEMEKAEQALARQNGLVAEQDQILAAEALDKATRPPAPAASAVPPDSAGPEGMATPAQVGQARDLANRQRDLQEQVRLATERAAAAGDEQAAANRQQQDMAKQAGDLARSLDEASGGFPDAKAQEAARAAAAAAHQGEQSLQQAQGNDAGQAKQARKQAAEALDRAAGQAEEAAGGGEPGQPENGPSQGGKQLQAAQGQMSQARSQLGQNQAQQAGGSMQRAADALREAAKQIGQPGDPQGPRDGGSPAEVATQGKGAPTNTDLPKELQKYAGKKWGELPGELRTRIVEDVKAQYGDDYGRIIKLYFEQIAANGTKK